MTGSARLQAIHYYISVNIISSLLLFSHISLRSPSPIFVLHSHGVPHSQKVSPNRKRKNSVTKSCLPTVDIRSFLRDTVRRSPLPRTLFLEGLVIHVAGLLKKRRRGWTPRHCSRIDAPRRLSSPFRDLPRPAVVDGRAPAWRIYAFMVAPESAGG